LAGFGKVAATALKAILTIINSGVDVPGILQNLARNAQAGKSLDLLKVGEEWERKGK
jgi:hypothetical protein